MEERKLLTNYALVTGASSGIGLDMCKELAKRKHNLIIVARGEEKLNKLKKELVETFEIKVEVIPMDLSAKDSALELYKKIIEKKLNVIILINNAGYGIHEYFVDIEWKKEEAMLSVLIMNLTHLTKLFAKDMVAKNSGRILLTSSTGAFQPTPSYATYAAAKNYVFNFGNALNYELRNTNVQCSVLCPGYTITGFQEAAGQNQETLYMKMTKMTSKQVAKIAINKFLNGNAVIIPGFINAFNARIAGIVPNKIASAFSLSALGEPDKD